MTNEEKADFWRGLIRRRKQKPALWLLDPAGSQYFLITFMFLFGLLCFVTYAGWIPTAWTKVMQPWQRNWVLVLGLFCMAVAWVSSRNWLKEFGRKKSKPEFSKVIEPEELTDEEAREIMKTSQPAPGKLDSTKELHTVQDLFSQTVTEIKEAQNNPAKLTQIIRNNKTRFQDESWRKLVVSKLTKLETILAVKAVIIKDQELNRELGTAYLDDQIKIKEKENRLAELDANTAEWKKKARDHEKEDEEPIITPSKSELKRGKIRERLEEKDAMAEEIRIDLDKLIDENEFREKRQKKWPDDEKNNSRLADIKNQIQKLEMTLKNL